MKFKTVENIIEGYLKELKIESLSQSDKDLAVSRLSICVACPLYKNGYCDTNGKIKNVKTGQVVKGCGCRLKAKVLCGDCSCPADKW